MRANEPTAAINVVRDIQARCRQWFAANKNAIQHPRTGIHHPLAVSILLTELSLVEIHLTGDSFLNPTELRAEQKKDSQFRGDIIASVEQMITTQPQFETQLRPDLDRLWSMYLPKTDELELAGRPPQSAGCWMLGRDRLGIGDH